MNQSYYSAGAKSGNATTLEPLREQIWSRYRVPLSWTFATVLFIEYVVAGRLPHNLFDVHESATIFGVSLVLMGAAMRSWANGILHKNSTLTVTGPYRLVRHPLYLGSFLLMTGMCILLADWVIYLAALVLVLTSYRQTIVYEESKLAKRFGKRWIDYKTYVPMLLPRFSRDALNHSDWNLSRWRKNREHLSILAIAFALMTIQLYHDLF
jgi:protein-S-isoprenylcysteine O-methyltransferase Ste14